MRTSVLIWVITFYSFIKLKCKMEDLFPRINVHFNMVFKLQIFFKNEELSDECQFSHQGQLEYLLWLMMLWKNPVPQLWIPTILHSLLDAREAISAWLHWRPRGLFFSGIHFNKEVLLPLTLVLARIFLIWHPKHKQLRQK